MATATKASRFDMRLTSEQRSEIERAAAIQGKTLTQWALDHLLEAARHDVERETTTRLASEAFDQFAAALDQPMPAAAQALMEHKAVWE
ncbi:DUF1778 domain-containing protein [Adlercreutzia caecimuris]|nr:DUF1778 domain-containing protein [Adlercreutzia caecimuris]